MKAGQGQLTEGEDLETVGISVSDYVLDGKMTARFYDLAGQVEYYGLHQLFMTSRAVYVLTWDASKFLRHTEVMTPVVKKGVRFFFCSAVTFKWTRWPISSGIGNTLLRTQLIVS